MVLEGTPAPWGGASQRESGPINHRRPTPIIGEVDPVRDTSQGNVVTHPEGEGEGGAAPGTPASSQLILTTVLYEGTIFTSDLEKGEPRC